MLEKIFLVNKFSDGFIFSYAHFHVLKQFPTFFCDEYYVAAWIFVFKDMSVQVQHADCCMMHHNCMNFCLIEVTNLRKYLKQQFSGEVYTVVFQAVDIRKISQSIKISEGCK